MNSSQAWITARSARTAGFFTRPRAQVALAIVTLMASLSLTGCQPGSNEPDLTGQPAPGFALPDLEGEQVKLSDFNDQVVLLNFWATWCPPCIQEIPHFIELQKEYQDKGFTVLGISVDQGGASDVKPFAKNHGINYPLLLANRKVQQDYGGISAIPVTFIIDRQGTVQAQFLGSREKAVFEEQIQKLIN